MLTHTFCHLPGITAKRERELWDLGILTWDNFLEADSLPLTKNATEKARAGLQASIEALEKKDIAFFFDTLKKEQWRLFPHFRDSIAYFDIETTGFNEPGNYISTICIWDGDSLKSYVCNDNLDEFMNDFLEYKLLISFNGRTFDVPFIKRIFRREIFTAHIDLRYVMKSLGYSGGLKRIEKHLGLDRRDLADLEGAGAVVLWNHYMKTGHQPALDTLLAYNALDVINLEKLMLIAYNKKLDDTAFPQSLQLEEKHDHVDPPFPVDPKMIQLANRNSFSW